MAVFNFLSEAPVIASFGIVPLSTVLLITLVAVFIIIRRVLFGSLRHVPGPLSSLLSGLPLKLDGVKGRRVYGLEQLHAKYGPVVRTGPNEVSLSSWRHLRTIYTTNKGVLKDPSFYTAATFVGRHNLFEMIDPAMHSARRKLSSPPYSLQSVALLDPIIKDKSESLVRRLVNTTSASATVDAFHLCGLYSFEVVCAAGFAKEFPKDSIDDSASSLLKAMDGSALTLIFDGVLPLLSSTGLGEKLPGPVGDAYRCREYWRVRSREMVDHFLKSSTSEEKYLLTPLATGHDAFLGRKLNHEELVEEAMSYMFAGSGTTSGTLTYILYELSKPENSHMQDRLQKEVLGLPVDDINAVRHNAYVNAVIKETMRLHPTIISTMPRLLTEPMQIDEFRLPRGTVVGMQNWIHHRDPVVFPQPDRFVPDRWLEPSKEMELALTPFGLGRRNCIGQNLAWQELYWALYSVMRAGLKFRLGAEMESWEMEMEDRFNSAPRGKRLMLEVSRSTV